jgi:WD40 repeat protein
MSTTTFQLDSIRLRAPGSFSRHGKVMKFVIYRFASTKEALWQRLHCACICNATELVQVDADFTDIMQVPLESKPCSVAFSSGGQYLYVGGTSKALDMYTADGLHLSTIATKDSWIWAVAPRPSSDTGLLQVACGCEDGTISFESIAVSTVHALYRVCIHLLPLPGPNNLSMLY